MERRNVGCQPNSMRKILIVDDHAIVRQGLALLINQTAGLSVCAEAEEAEIALRLVREEQPDLVIVDLTLKDASGLELINQIKLLHATLPVLVLSMHHEPFYIERALKAGASGYVTKQDRAENLLLAIQTVLNGEMYMDHGIREQMLHSYLGRPAARSGPAIEQLTAREFEILQMLGRGEDTRRIALLKHISVKTVETHRNNIRQKLGLKTNTQFLQYAFKFVQSQS